MSKIGDIISNPSVIGQYIVGVMGARNSNCSSYDLAFVKEANGNWYIDLPQWQGAHGNLQMVAGADKLLDGLLTEGNRVEVQVVRAKQKVMDLKRMTHISSVSE